MYFRSNKLNSNEIHCKFDRFHNDKNIINIKIINKISFNLNLNDI